MVPPPPVLLPAEDDHKPFSCSKGSYLYLPETASTGIPSQIVRIDDKVGGGDEWVYWGRWMMVGENGELKVIKELGPIEIKFGDGSLTEEYKHSIQATEILKAAGITTIKYHGHQLPGSYKIVPDTAHDHGLENGVKAETEIGEGHSLMYHMILSEAHQTLQSILPHISARATAKFLLSLSDLLDALHAAGYVHGNLDPYNIKVLSFWDEDKGELAGGDKIVLGGWSCFIRKDCSPKELNTTPYVLNAGYIPVQGFPYIVEALMEVAMSKGDLDGWPAREAEGLKARIGFKNQQLGWGVRVEQAQMGLVFLKAVLDHQACVDKVTACGSWLLPANNVQKVVDTFKNSTGENETAEIMDNIMAFSYKPLYSVRRFELAMMGTGLKGFLPIFEALIDDRMYTEEDEAELETEYFKFNWFARMRFHPKPTEPYRHTIVGLIPSLSDSFAATKRRREPKPPKVPKKAPAQGTRKSARVAAQPQA